MRLATRSWAPPLIRSPGRSCGPRVSRRLSSDRPGARHTSARSFSNRASSVPASARCSNRRWRATCDSCRRSSSPARPSRTTRRISTCARWPAKAAATACRRCGSTICCTRRRPTRTSTASRGRASWPPASSHWRSVRCALKTSRRRWQSRMRRARRFAGCSRCARIRPGSPAPKRWRSPGRSFSWTARVTPRSPIVPRPKRNSARRLPARGWSSPAPGSTTSAFTRCSNRTVRSWSRKTAAGDRAAPGRTSI